MAFLQYQPRNTLFHYCRPDGFDGITESSSIWLSDLRFANDPKELQLAEVIETLMQELVCEPKTSVEVRSACEALGPRLRRFRNRGGINSFSLSLEADQLPMWQEYTDRGRGFCIGFRATTFNHMPLRIQKVEYVQEDYFGCLHDRVRALVHPLVGHEYDQIKQSLAASEILSLATSVKDHTWQHEKEVRLVFASMARPSDFEPGQRFQIAEFADGTPVYPEDPLYRGRDSEKVPYHVKPFGRLREGVWDASSAIETVIVGSNNVRAIDEVKDNLLGRGYKNFEVVQSKCVFR